MTVTVQDSCASVVSSFPIERVEAPKRIRKRDGSTLQSFDYNKIERAIRGAWGDTEETVNEATLTRVAAFVANTLHADVTDVEQIQDAVEVALMKYNLYAVAKAYIVYRQKRTTLRETRLTPDPLAVSDYIHASKYARYLPTEKRREIFPETIARAENMHLNRFSHLPELQKDIRWAFDQVRAKRVLPSMRSMQFGGTAVEANNCRIYNCSFSFIDRPRVFAEALYLLLCGCGVGYSVQFDHVDKLPPLRHIDPKKVVHHIIADTIEGWADALEALVDSYVKGYLVEFSYHLIREAGSPLKTSGGKAPGHLKLKESLERIRTLLHAAQGRKLRSVECHRVMCHAADAVLSGGIRRSAMICLFSLEDSEMVYLKTGDWYKNEPYLANANNTVVLKRDEVKRKQFRRIFKMVREWGEPGFLFVTDTDYGTNPCGEIGMNPKLIVNDNVRDLIIKKVGARASEELVEGTELTGWGFCNLTEMNAARFTSLEDMEEVARAATIIATVQASYTSMPYLGWVSEVLAEREALLGIGMTGMFDAPQVALDPENQRIVAAKIKEWNWEIATQIGIRPAARTTCVKPSGTTSLELGCVASGHHPHHARRYIRRVTADELETIFQIFKTANPHMCVRKPDGKWVIEFPVQAPEGAIIKDDLLALDFLNMVKSTQQHWVLPGTARDDVSPGLAHNVSNTVQVRPEEWDKVSDYLWKNRGTFTGVTLLAATGDKDYAFAPCEAISTQADEIRWNQLVSNYHAVDYTAEYESDDGTNLSGELACAGGSCEIHV